jgi:hypothetical protein
MTYTAYKIGIDGETKMNKENLDSIDEVNEWLVNRQYNNVLIVQNETGKTRRMFRVEGTSYK